MRRILWLAVAALVFGSGFTVGAYFSPQDMSLVGHVYESPTTDAKIRMLLEEANLGGNEVEIGEITFPAVVNSGEHLHGATEIFYILDGEVTFRFDDQTVVASRGMTINIPPSVVHEVSSKDGARLITVFSPGGFYRYLEEMAAMTEAQFADAALMQTLAEKYDIWPA